MYKKSQINKIEENVLTLPKTNQIVKITEIPLNNYMFFD